MIRKIAVTGTKGKSTVLRLLEQVFLDLNRNVYGTYGIDGYYYNKKKVREGANCENYLVWDNRTMPADVHLSEATSYTLKSGFYNDYVLDLGIFTSFDETEHQELHKKPKNYLSAKKKLFDSLGADKKMVVCRDIPNYHEVVAGHEKNIISYGIHPESEYNIKINMITKDKMIFLVRHPKGEIFFKTKLLGEFNAKNITAAFAGTMELGLTMESTVSSLERFKGLKGRLERFYIPETNNDIIIDYAHTCESLELLLKLCKIIYSDKEIIVVFGCGGDKSKVKRLLMGQIADRHASFSIITNDNPRKESPADIVAEILSGFDSENFFVVLDREEAIKSTLSGKSNVVIVLAGKGAEEEIQFRNLSIYHNDYNCLMEWCVQNNLRLISYV